MLTFPEGYRIVGLFGRDGSRLDNLGFILGKTEYHKNGEIQIVKKQLLIEE